MANYELLRSLLPVKREVVADEYEILHSQQDPEKIVCIINPDFLILDIEVPTNERYIEIKSPVAIHLQISNLVDSPPSLKNIKRLHLSFLEQSPMPSVFSNKHSVVEFMGFAPSPQGFLVYMAEDILNNRYALVSLGLGQLGNYIFEKNESESSWLLKEKTGNNEFEAIALLDDLIAIAQSHLEHLDARYS